MGRVKDFYHEEICELATGDQCAPGPDDLEMLAIDAERAQERYLAALIKHNAEKKNGKSF